MARLAIRATVLHFCFCIHVCKNGFELNRHHDAAVPHISYWVCRTTRSRHPSLNRFGTPLFLHLFIDLHTQGLRVVNSEIQESTDPSFDFCISYIHWINTLRILDTWRWTLVGLPLSSNTRSWYRNDVEHINFVNFRCNWLGLRVVGFRLRHLLVFGQDGKRRDAVLPCRILLDR